MAFHLGAGPCETFLLPHSVLTGVVSAGLGQAGMVVGVHGGNTSYAEETIPQWLSWSLSSYHLSAPAPSVFPEPLSGVLVSMSHLGLGTPELFVLCTLISWKVFSKERNFFGKMSGL